MTARAAVFVFNTRHNISQPGNLALMYSKKSLLGKGRSIGQILLDPVSSIHLRSTQKVR